MSKGKIERPDLKQLKKRAENGWGASPNHVLWMIDMLEKVQGFIGYRYAWENEDEWQKEYDKANGT